jgi:hypothetical protein
VYGNPLTQEVFMTTVRTFISLLVHGPQADESAVHFHQGPQGSPAVCHDSHCDQPRLTV